MNKKDLLAPIAIISLSIIFAIFSIAVFMTKGKSSFWISKKFKIGALLLTFTSIVACKPKVSCYEPAVENWITLDGLDYNSYELVLDSSRNDTIHGYIQGVSSSNFSFNFTDTLGNTILKDNVIALDGDFEDYNEKFDIFLKEYLIPGDYQIIFHNTEKEEQTNNSDIAGFNIKIIE